MGDAELRNAETADANASAPSGAQEDLSRFVHSYFFEPCAPSRRNLIACLPFHLYGLLTVGVRSAKFDNVSALWKYKLTEEKSTRYWGVKATAHAPLNTVTRLKKHGLECNRLMTGRNEGPTMVGSLESVIIDTPPGGPRPAAGSWLRWRRRASILGSMSRRARRTRRRSAGYARAGPRLLRERSPLTHSAARRPTRRATTTAATTETAITTMVAAAACQRRGDSSWRD